MQNDLFDDFIDYGFDPNDIDISVQNISLYYLLRRLEFGEIDLFASYQRNWNLWNTIQQSRLIESILIRIPIPSFYFDTKEDGKWQVVDGLQRVTTFYNFIIEEKFRLIGLEFLPQFNGYRFSELPRELQRRIEEFSLNIYLINRGTPENIKFIIFSRINTGGVQLNSQELRYALNQGKATKLLDELSETREFIEAIGRFINSKRMADIELINRFFAFYLFKIDYNGDLDLFLNFALHRINHMDFKLEVLKEDFLNSMKYSIKIFGDYRFKRTDQINRVTRPNKLLFEVISVNLAWLEIVQLEILFQKRESVAKQLNELFYDDLFIDSILSSTNSRRKVDYRFEEVRKVFKNHLS